MSCKIVKAEILWSRKCNMGCPYCAMPTGADNTLSVAQWKKGFDELKKLGCGFAAFYGAEPLIEFDKLPDVMGYAESIGIHTTVITTGKVPSFYEKLRTLHKAGAKSLSMSYDTEVSAFGDSRKNKSNASMAGLQYFRDLGNIRDVAAICTLTSKNYKSFLAMVKMMSREGVWSFFDIIHPDRKQPGTKCRNTKDTESLLFTYITAQDLIKNTLPAILKMKEAGLLVHTSKYFMDLMKKDNGKDLLAYTWKCCDSFQFPSWVTVDCDGTVYPCDDFQIYNPMTRSFNIVNISESFERFGKFWNPIVRRHCPGCCWNTHIDACAIKAGEIPFTDYVHTTGS